MSGAIDAYIAVCMVNSFRSKLIHKSTFAVLTSAGRTQVFTKTAGSNQSHVLDSSVYPEERYQREEIDLEFDTNAGFAKAE